jgi:hypothetical protein
MVVSRRQMHRTLVIVQAIFSEAERRGYSVEAVDSRYSEDTGVGIVIRGHAYPLTVEEETGRERLTHEEVERWRRDHYWYSESSVPRYRRIPNGRVKLSIPSAYDGARRSCSDGATATLDSKLAELFVELERRAVKDDQRLLLTTSCPRINSKLNLLHNHQ